MNTRAKLAGSLYRRVLKPWLFIIDAEKVHNVFTDLGEKLENSNLISWMFAGKQSNTNKSVLGIEFSNPVGLAAGFDYNGRLAKVARQIGFGFNTVGTVTAKPYGGNPAPRLIRLPKSRSILVNKGFKSEGATAVAKRLDVKNLTDHTVGISVGSTNIPEINSISKAIDDYLFTFDIFRNKPYVKYFELNISCPNAAMSESFGDEKNFKNLVSAVTGLNIHQPIFVKMSNEIEYSKADALVRSALSWGVRGFIFSNLIKDRNNSALDKGELEKIKFFKGNFSGQPTFVGSNNLIAHVRHEFGKDVAIVGCGGIFSPADAMAKFNAGADLVQLITGMIYQGPQLIGEICNGLDQRQRS
ncbi:MAG: quinone-dependent dihydroorotate dehydrogenase [bacterium]|nr:quinone-dependent dihydroorotate dehydrogenase [bacterium]